MGTQPLAQLAELRGESGPAALRIGFRFVYGRQLRHREDPARRSEIRSLRYRPRESLQGVLLAIQADQRSPQVVVPLGEIGPDGQSLFTRRQRFFGPTKIK
jgi:hypothetical protein